MATNTEKITIKFEAAGNKAMQLALMNLDVATKRLNGQTSEYAKHLSGLGLTQREVNKLLAKQNDLTLFGVKNQRLLGNSFATIRSKLLLYSFAVTLATAAFTKLFKKSIEQEKAEKKLETALGHTNKKLLEQASAFQEQSKHGDSPRDGTAGRNHPTIHDRSPGRKNLLAPIHRRRGGTSPPRRRRDGQGAAGGNAP